MLKRNAISFRELTSKDEEINLYPSIKADMGLITTNKGAVASMKWIVMEPRDIKRAI
jgi:MSV199 domain